MKLYKLKKNITNTMLAGVSIMPDNFNRVRKERFIFLREKGYIFNQDMDDESLPCDLYKTNKSGKKFLLPPDWLEEQE